MQQQTLSRWLKGIIIGMAVCGLAVYGLAVPGFGRSIVDSYPEFSHFYRPWLVFLWLTALPCFAALALAWGIARGIGEDRSFTMDTARRLRRIAQLAAGDAAFFFAGNVVLLLAGRNHPGVALMSLLLVFAGAAIAVASACLSHLVKQAALLQEQSDLTI